MQNSVREGCRAAAEPQLAHEPTANPAPASTGQPEKGGDELIAAARDSLPLRGATQLRRGTKHHTPPRSRRPASEPDAPPSSARPKKGARKQLALAAVLAARPPRRPVSALLFYAAEHRARIKMEAPHREAMEGVRAEFEALDAEVEGTWRWGLGASAPVASSAAAP